jgi:hypothetical protein
MESDDGVIVLPFIDTRAEIQRSTSRPYWINRLESWHSFFSNVILSSVAAAGFSSARIGAVLCNEFFILRAVPRFVSISYSSVYIIFGFTSEISVLFLPI